MFQLLSSVQQRPPWTGSQEPWFVGSDMIFLCCPCSSLPLSEPQFP
jgi:hypothetical protein